MEKHYSPLRFLFYLLILFLPIQLGQHFFFTFSFLAGVRSDYLAPTIYLTDAIAWLFIAGYLVSLLRLHALRPSRWQQLLTFFGILLYLAATSWFVAANPWAALYRSGKLLEWLAVGYIAVRIQPRLSLITLFLSVAVCFVSLVAIGQFTWQRSLGEWGWFVGERTFSVSTPGIATMTVGGQKILRAYGTFPHPNVLGGFLAIALVIIAAHLRREKQKTGRWTVWYCFVWLVGAIALADTGSRTAWAVALIGTLLLVNGLWWQQVRQHSYLWAIAILLAVFGTALLPFVWSAADPALIERTRLTREAVSLFLHSPIWGAGVNMVFPKTAPFQPVHHLFLLLFAEIGVVGGAWCVWELVTILRRSLQTGRLPAIIAIQWVCLGMFDHYLITLQQGLMLTMLVATLVFLPQNLYTDNTYEGS